MVLEGESYVLARTLHIPIMRPLGNNLQIAQVFWKANPLADSTSCDHAETFNTPSASSSALQLSGSITIPQCRGSCATS
eukprot:5961778-Pleurochrysis_carterae.AAC.1